ncbi:MAG TPA: hypothetical protein VL984_04690 [Acidimicrobiales bacterium]|nr:hypothetical protein [Acidimicrobiales bacterium]
MAPDLTAQLAELFDSQITFHGFTAYMRDYEVFVFQPVDPNPKYGLIPRHLRFLFRLCPEVHTRSRAAPETWARSVDDALTRTTTVTRDATGYVWGVAGQVAYPGGSLVSPSSRAQQWSDAAGIDFQEVCIEANAHEISIVFSDLVVEEVAAGYTPYRVEAEGVAERYAAASKIPLRPDREEET